MSLPDNDAPSFQVLDGSNDICKGWDLIRIPMSLFRKKHFI